MVNTITFGGVDSSTYDIYVSGEGVWSAPKRATEAINIPGRNGAFIQDKGKFENITVTYPAFIVKDNNTNFKTKIDSFRNAMASQVGYQRLVDTFHSDEYRMAAFIDGLEVEPILYNDHAATFDLVFECMPQRFLTSGEVEQTIAASNTPVTNPSLFDSHPLFKIWGYGSFGIDGKQLAITQQPYGYIKVHNTTTSVEGMPSVDIPINDDLISSGNQIIVNEAKFTLVISTSGDPDGEWIGDYNVSHDDSDYLTFRRVNYNSCELIVGFTGKTFNKGTSGAYYISAKVRHTKPDLSVESMDYTFRLSYNGTDTITMQNTETLPANWSIQTIKMGSTPIFANSTKLPVGEPPIYIDLDIGEAYTISNGELVSANSAITMPTDIPTFPSGEHRIQFDNTITTFKMIPRWWKI